MYFVLRHKFHWLIYLNSFEEHRSDNKAPFMMIIDATFAQNEDLMDGVAEFLQYIRAVYKVGIIKKHEFM